MTDEGSIESCSTLQWNLVSWVFVCRKTYLNLCMKKIWTGLQESSSHSTTRTQTCSTWLERSHITRILCTLDPLRHAMCSDVFPSCPQGDGNIRYYELSAEKPYLSFLTEYRSPLPQKGLGEIRKGGRCCKCRYRMSTWVID